MNKEEKKLLELLQKQDFETIYTTYHSTIYRIAFSILKNKENSEEVVQNVFTKLLTLKPNVFPQKNAYSWLYQVVKNETFQWIRKQQNWVAIEEIYDLGVDDEELEKRISQQDYEKLISKLSLKEQEVVNLRLISDFSFRQIGEILAIPTATVQWRYYTALHTLQLLLSNLAMTILSVFVYFGMYQNRQKETQQEPNIANETEKVEISLDTANNSTEKIEQEADKEIREETQQSIQENIENSGLEIGILSFSGMFFCMTLFFGLMYAKYQYRKKHKIKK